MIFSSTTFLFLFLPLVLLATFAAGKRFRNHIFFAASLLFYFWGEGVFVLLLLFSIFATFITGRLIESSKGHAHTFLLTLGIGVNLIPLLILKYLHFFLDAITPLCALLGFPPFSSDIPLHLPAGISFFTFQAISYLIDVHRGITPAEPNLLGCGLYISMFPQLIAGPIVRYHEIAKQLQDRRVHVRQFAEGAERFMFGLAKKTLLADPLGVRADAIFNLPVHNLSVSNSWLGALCFSLQIYYDFSGYSDMAIGLGKMFGFELPENFNYPYISRSMREFWRRWHISLSTWLRDYLYIPLGGNRKGTPRTLANLFIVFLLCGLWHGANWTFVCWGIWHGMFLMLERGVNLQLPKKTTALLSWFYTTAVVLFGWVLFRSPGLETARQFMTVMLGLHRTLNTLPADIFSPTQRLFLTETTTAILLSMPVYGLLKQRAAKFRATRSALLFHTTTTICSLGRIALFATLLYIVFITLAAQAFRPFLYFQF